MYEVKSRKKAVTRKNVQPLLSERWCIRVNIAYMLNTTNRFNPILAGYDNFQKLFLEENARSAPAALVIGGLQMMEGYEYGKDERARYFGKIKSLMSEAKAATRIHFELASFVDETILSDIKENVIPFSDSIGMNEQELPNLLSLMKTGKSVSVATAYPR